MRVACLFFALCLLPAGVRAEYMFQLDIPTSYASGLAGATVTQDLFLVASGTDNLNSAGQTEFNLNGETGSGKTKITSFTADSQFPGIPPFFTTSSTLTPTGVQVRLYTTGAPATLNRVRLGSIEMLLGGTGSTTAFTFSDPGVSSTAPFGENVIISPTSGTYTTIDSMVFSGSSAGFSANVAAVPEPSSFALLTLGVLGMASRRRRRPAA